MIIRRLDARDLEMHRVRNRALQRVLRSILAVKKAEAAVAQARLNARRKDQDPWNRLPPERPRTTPRRRNHLRLVTVPHDRGHGG